MKFIKFLDLPRLRAIRGVGIDILNDIFKIVYLRVRYIDGITVRSLYN